MTRRNWFALLLAPFVARLRPRPPISMVALYEARMVEAYARMQEQMMQDLLMNGQAYIRVFSADHEDSV